MRHVYLPPCAGLYHYWFGVMQAIQDALTDEEIDDMHFHTISGSGFSAGSLLSGGFRVGDIYLLWCRRYRYLIRRGGFPFIYHLTRKHIGTIFSNRSYNFDKLRQSGYCTTVPGLKFIAPKMDSPDSCASVLTASATIPFIGLKWGIFHQGRFILDGALNPLLTGRSPYKLVKRTIPPESELIHLGKILNYNSVQNANFLFFWGIIQSKSRYLFDCGYNDMMSNMALFNKASVKQPKEFLVLEEHIDTSIDILNYQRALFRAIVLALGIGFRSRIIAIVRKELFRRWK